MCLWNYRKKTCKITILCSLRVNSSFFCVSTFLNCERHMSSFFQKLTSWSIYFPLVKGTYTHDINTIHFWKFLPLPLPSNPSGHKNSSIHYYTSCATTTVLLNNSLHLPMAQLHCNPYISHWWATLGPQDYPKHHRATSSINN